MGRRRQPSSIDRLPPKIREEIGRLRQNDRFTIDQILEHLRKLDVDVSRSALGRHCKSLDEVAEELQRSRGLAEALVARFGDDPDDRLQRANIELMHSVVFQTLTAAPVDEDGQAQPVTFDPQQVMFLAKSLSELSRAQATEAQRMLKLKAEVARQAAAAVDKVVKGQPGMTRQTVEDIKAAILGIAKPAGAAA